MQLLKAYETVLRSEGILPVSDSKIYNLVFNVFSRGEQELNQSSFNNHSDSLSLDAHWFNKSLREHQEEAELTLRAQAYHEFMLQQKTLEAFKEAIERSRGQSEKENSQRSVNESVD